VKPRLGKGLRRLSGHVVKAICTMATGIQAYDQMSPFMGRKVTVYGARCPCLWGMEYIIINELSDYCFLSARQST
jgi:hypothetical protein